MTGDFRFIGRLRESHELPIYSVAFNTIDSEYADWFVSVGGHRVSLYHCPPRGAIVLMQQYVEAPSADAAHHHFCCAWSSDAEGQPLVLVGGDSHVLRIISVRDSVVHDLLGHGGDINDVCVLAASPRIAATASRDRSIRVWDVHDRTCLCVIAGQAAHQHEVTNVAFCPTSPRLLLSCGLDGRLRIWDLEALTAPLPGATGPDPHPPRTRRRDQHVWANDDLHDSEVDCVAWCGELAFSKSVSEGIFVWKPTDVPDSMDPEQRSGSDFVLVKQLALPDQTGEWFLRFCVSQDGRTLACGSEQGEVFVWDGATLVDGSRVKLQPSLAGIVYRTALSGDGHILVAGYRDGSLMRWDRVQSAPPDRLGCWAL